MEAAFALIKPLWKPLAMAAVVWAFTSYRDHLIAKGDAAGFLRAEKQYQAAVEAANKISDHDQHNLDLMSGAFNGLVTLRQQQLALTIQPKLERMQNEITNDPRYRSCSVSDSVLSDLQAIRATVDAGIRASDPR